MRVSTSSIEPPIPGIAPGCTKHERYGVFDIFNSPPLCQRQGCSSFAEAAKERPIKLRHPVELWVVGRRAFFNALPARVLNCWIRLGLGCATLQQGRSSLAVLFCLDGSLKAELVRAAVVRKHAFALCKGGTGQGTLTLSPFPVIYKMELSPRFPPEYHSSLYSSPEPAPPGLKSRGSLLGLCRSNHDHTGPQGRNGGGEVP